jgi:hypothetical protein
MPVAPAYGGGGFGGGDNGWWIIVLLLAFSGGWGGGFGGGYGNAALGIDFPWVLNGQQQIQGNMADGFRDQMISSNLGDIQGAISSGFGNLTTQLYTSQISDLERSFAAQTALSQGLNSLQASLSTCCCENRLANCQTNNTIISEGAATRSAIQAGVQSIKDMLCQQELDAERRDNQNLRSELMYARGQASQVAQTAAIEASQTAQTQYIVNRVAPYPIPAYVVANPVTPAVAV